MPYLKKTTILLLLLAFDHLLLADAGPKPSMKFKLIYKTSREVEVKEGWQLESNFESFNVFDTLLREGPQGFYITHDNASSVSYGYRDYHRIVIRFDDRIRTSNVFTDESFNSTFEINVFDNRLEVIDVTPFLKDSSVWAAFFIALLFTLLLELLVAFIYLKLAKKPLYILLYVILANLITLPLVWFLFPLFLTIGGALLTGEIFALITEALFLQLTCRKWFQPSGAFLLSFMMNLLSFLIGGLALLLMIGF